MSELSRTSSALSNNETLKSIHLSCIFIQILIQSYSINNLFTLSAKIEIDLNYVELNIKY